MARAQEFGTAQLVLHCGLRLVRDRPYPWKKIDFEKGCRASVPQDAFLRGPCAEKLRKHKTVSVLSSETIQAIMQTNTNWNTPNMQKHPPPRPLAVPTARARSPGRYCQHRITARIAESTCFHVVLAEMPSRNVEIHDVSSFENS